MNRRTFLRWALPAAATAIVAPEALLEAALDPDRLTWVPGRKTTFDLHIPGQRLVYPESLHAEAWRILNEQLKMWHNTSRQWRGVHGAEWERDMNRAAAQYREALMIDAEGRRFSMRRHEDSGVVIYTKIVDEP